ncbi:hypothetical protein BD779DRAFT_438517 [Infundibulicybe gibba]|nr:hypothetical protein BD779DRAFT_438517 [Infundibulicybe gibba]
MITRIYDTTFRINTGFKCNERPQQPLPGMRFTATHLTLGVTLAQSFKPGYTFVARSNPSAHDWDALNSTVGGRLAIGVPWSKPCFSSFNSLSINRTERM